MEYFLNTLMNEQLLELLGEIPEGTLRDYLIQDQKHFEKSKHTRGFRLNKLPKSHLYKVCIEEISSMPNTVLEKKLIQFIKFNFKDTNIEKIIEDFSGDVLKTAFELERELISKDFTISPTMVLLITKHSITDSEKSLIDSYHKFYLETKERVEKRTKEDVEEKISKKYDALSAEYDKIKSAYSLCRKESSNFRNELLSQEGIIKNKEQEISALVSRIKAAENDISEIKMRYADYSEKTRIISEQAKEIKSLSSQNEELQQVISDLSTSILTPNTVTEMCNGILDDLQQESLENEYLVKQAKTLFSEDESVIDAWERLSENEKEKINNIVLKMNNNGISHNDIGVLEDVETYIHIKYMIVKSLVVVFYKYLEQNASEKKLTSKFEVHKS